MRIAAVQELKILCSWCSIAYVRAWVPANACLPTSFVRGAEGSSPWMQPGCFCAYNTTKMQEHTHTLHISVCCSTQTKYWIPVLETYWSIITSMAFQKILVQYQYSIEILNYFPVSLSVFQKKFRGPKFENSIFLKINHFRKNIVINFFSCPLSNFSQEMPNC